MTDKNLIEIAQIKDLTTIYFYYTNSSFKELSKCLGLRVVYGDHKYLKYDYRSEYFQDFVSKVFDVYKKEKDKNNIILLGNLSKEILQTDVSSLYNEEKNVFTQNTGISLLNNNTHQILQNSEYIKDVLGQILRTITVNPFAVVNEIKGYNNNYVAFYNIEDIEGTLPFLCSFEDNIINITLNNINGKAREVNVTIKYDYDKIQSAFKSSDDVLVGTTLYNYSDNTVTKKTIFNKEIIDFDSDSLSISEDELSTIKFYSNLFSLECTDTIKKTVPGSFIFFNSKKMEESGTDVLLEDKSLHFFIKEDEVNILNLNKAGLSKDSSNILFVLNESSEKITLKLIELDNKSYVIIQKTYSQCDKADGYYKDNLEGNFSYSVLEVDNGTVLNKPFKINNQYEINEEAKSLEKIKTLIKNQRVE